MKDVATVTHLITEEGIAVVILSCVVVLGFIYFWKMINRKTMQEKSCEKHGSLLKEVVDRLQGLREDLIVVKGLKADMSEIKGLILGRFRNMGDKHDND